MKRFGLIGLLVLMLHNGWARDAVLISPQFLFPGAGASTNGAGFAFRPKVPILITALRYDFHPSVLAFATSRVDFLNVSGQLLATALLDTNAAALGQDYLELNPPLVIPAGTTNFLRASILLEEPIPGEEFFWFGGVAPTNEITVASELDYLGSGFGVDLNHYALPNFHIGANFRFEPIPLVNLQINLTDSNYLRLSWPSAAGDYVLHSGPSPDAPMTPVLQLPELIGAERVVTVPIQTSNCYFRLVR